MSKTVALDTIIAHGTSNLRAKEGDVIYLLTIKGLLICDESIDVRFEIKREKRNTSLMVYKGSSRIRFSLADTSTPFRPVEKPADLPETIWERFIELYGRFHPYYEGYRIAGASQKIEREQEETQKDKALLDEIETTILGRM